MIFPAERKRILSFGEPAGTRGLSDLEIDRSWKNTAKCHDGQFNTRASPGERGIFKNPLLS